MAENRQDKDVREEDIVDFLSDPASYGTPTASVDVIETHAARVFLTGTKAYKIKKPVTLPFLDFSTRAQRQRALAREFELNHPQAPEIYVALESINREASGALTLAEGEPVEPVLVMNRFDQENLLAHVVESAPLKRETARDLALMVARYHRMLPPLLQEPGATIMRDIAGQLANQIENLAALGEGGEMTGLARNLREAAERAAPLLDARAKQGHVRRCHGDLHLGNIVLLDGRPVPFDALEFDEKLAITDVLYDLAFLLMDLDVRGQRTAANAALNVYVAADPTGDEIEGLAALPLFLAARATVRAVVALEGARQSPDTQAREDNTASAAHYLKAAASYLSPPQPQLLAVGGLSGTGKSTLSAALAHLIGAAPGALILRTDVERKRIFGVPETERLAPEHYTEEVSAQVYARLYDKTRRALAAGHAVIFDGVSSKPEERDAIADIAQAAGCRFHGLWLEAPVGVQVARVNARRGDASDSDETVVRAQAVRDLGPITWTRIEAGRSAEHTLKQAKAALGLGS